MLLGAVVLSISRWASFVPHAVLAAVLCRAAFYLIDWRFLARLRHAPREHLVIVMVTLSVTLCFDLITAVAAGFVTAALAGARQLERLEMDRIVSAPLLDQVFLGSGNDEFSARVGLVRLQGSFTVASARKLIRVIAADIEDHDIIILDFSQTEYFDDSAAYVVEHMIHTADAEDTAVIVLGLRDSLEKSLAGLGMVSVIAAATLRASMAVIYSPIRSTRTIGGRCLSRGKTKREAIRALKRRISDRIWTHLNTTPLTQELS